MPERPTIDDPGAAAAPATPSDAVAVPGHDLSLRVTTRGSTAELELEGAAGLDAVPAVVALVDELRAREPALRFHLAADHPVASLDPLPEAVADGTTGLLGDEGDRAALAANLRKLLDDQDLQAAFGTAARARAVAEFDVVKQSHRLEDVYDEVTGQRI